MSENKSTSYDPHAIEEKWYPYWEENKFFSSQRNASKKPHVIMMPPPNVTGRLHMGHALQDTIQDALTRLRRMQGYEALWMPGIDHAGIATQNVVERTLKKEENKDRHDLGREAFIHRVWDWKQEYGDIILQQKRRLGDSCDWDRQRFTMDEGFTQAVQSVFVKLYEDGLIYRGDYMVNWCPVDMTALSDEEVDNVEQKGNLWYVQYPLSDGSGFITIATTRPETMLGDTAIAVHPEDERYQHLVGKTVTLPLTNREIPIIADEYVKPEFGAGALKITPGHDKNDFDIGKKHNLEILTVIDFHGKINENGGVYAGLDRFVARDQIVAALEAGGFLVKVEEYQNTVPISSRSKAIIEPLISRQWFLKMEPLAKRAIEVVKDGTVTFYPARWANEYFRWLENIRDWCISRQLWWGHRIPVWYYLKDNGEIDTERSFVVSVTQPASNMVQDEDVLDTWFSSWLWPFATLGWPQTEEYKEDLAYYYPGSVLVSGYDILFFWIARMIMAGLYCMDDVPYRDIFITGMIKDKLGRWMSKSLGNGIDPLDMIEQYGADAVRFSLTVLCAQGQDIKLDPSRFEMGRNFANKIWNAFRVFGNHKDNAKDYQRQRSFESLSLVEQWMVHRVNQTIEEVNADVEKYRLNEALGRIYATFWDDYCDWYLELIKPAYGETMSEETITLAIELFEKLLKLLHPFMPFITEELWWELRPRAAKEALIVASWPQSNEAEMNPEVATTFAMIQEMVSGIRNIKSQVGVPQKPLDRVYINVASDNTSLIETLQTYEDYFRQLAKVESVIVGSDLEKPEASSTVVVEGQEVFVPLGGLIDLEEERTRLQKEIKQKEGFLRGVQQKLANENFVSRAPAEVVEKEKQKEQDALADLEKLQANLESLG